MNPSHLRSPRAAEVDTQTVAVSVDPKTTVATITTTLSGRLNALYPARMAKEGKGGFNIFVPAEQSGKFADANICSAIIEENATDVQFKNKYALFIITPPEGTKSLTIKSLKGIGENGQRSGTQFTISAEFATAGTGSIKGIPMKAIEESKAGDVINIHNLEPFSSIARTIAEHHFTTKWFEDDRFGYICHVPSGKL